MKTVIRILLLGLFFSLIALGLISCGARKVDKERKKEFYNIDLVDKSKSYIKGEIKTESETNVKRSEETFINNQDQTVTKKETISPVDNTKPASYKDENGKVQELNNSTKTTETTTKKNNTKTENKVNTDEVKKESKDSIFKEKKANDINLKASSKKESELINVEREQFNWLSLWWLYLIIITIVYFIWRKFIKV